MPSGKQILLEELTKFSQRDIDEDSVGEVSDRFRAALLLHGSTADSAWPTVERVSWTKAGGVHGPSLASNGEFLANIFSSLLTSEIPESVKEDFPELTELDFRAAMRVMYMLITQFYYQPDLASVENDGNIEADKANRLIEAYMAKLRNYRANPEAWLGYSVDYAEEEI